MGVDKCGHPCLGALLGIFEGGTFGNWKDGFVIAFEFGLGARWTNNDPGIVFEVIGKHIALGEVDGFFGAVGECLF